MPTRPSAVTLPRLHNKPPPESPGAPNDEQLGPVPAGQPGLRWAWVRAAGGPGLLPVCVTPPLRALQGARLLLEAGTSGRRQL